ncbi:D-alanine--D-alanine ligase family protein [Virgifigura deserti]|uniref:D-alanine--D-alanine ligase family protein n=1 Tax=Virgifigura deserti TaxID=2268457 RepID=UPI003CCC2730
MIIPMKGRRSPKVALLYGAVAADAAADEQDVLVEIEAVRQALVGLGYVPVAVPLSLDLEAARRRLLDLRPSFVFNLVESIDGQDRLLHLAPALLDSLGLPYTGSGTEAVFLTSNKLVAKRQLAAAGIDTPAWTDGVPQDASPLFRGPYIVKSVWQHASIGLDTDSVVADSRKLSPLMRRRRRRFGGDWFAERFIDGREFNLALLAGPGGVELLPPAEMRFVGFPPNKPRIIDYAAKWDPASFAYHNTVRSFDFPAADAALLRRLEAIAKACWHLFGLRGYARVDCRVDADGRPWVLEVNVNPCISPDAGFAAAAARAGLDLTATIRRILADMAVPVTTAPAKRHSKTTEAGIALAAP